MCLTADCPRITPSQRPSFPIPMGVTTPMPVITTRLFGFDNFFYPLECFIGDLLYKHLADDSVRKPRPRKQPPRIKLVMNLDKPGRSKTGFAYLFKCPLNLHAARDPTYMTKFDALLLRAAST